VKSYKGAIDVYSEEGRGTTFKIFLPAVEKKGELPEMTEIKDMPRGTERILFVDDERVLTEIGSAQLQTLGYKVTTRSNGTGALALIKKEPDKFDLVITDLTMPQMTGDELAAQIKDIRPGIPIILCTGYSSKIDPDRPRLTGVDAVLLKPVVMQELANTVRNALDKSQPGQQ